METHSSTKLGRGTASQSTANPSDSETTFSSKTCPKPTESKSFEVLPWLCVKGDFLDHVMLPWLKAQSQIPSTMWLQSSGKTGTTTQNKRRAQRCTTFTASTKIVQKGQSKRSTTKSSSRLRPLTHPFLKIHKTCQAMGKLAGAAHFWAMRSCEYANVPKAEQRTMHQKHRFHQRQRNPNPKLSISSFGRLRLSHFRKT